MDPSQVDPQVLEMILQALMKQGAGGGQAQELAAYDQLGPEGFAQHSNMGTLDERGALAAQESRAQQEMVAQQLGQMEKFSEAQGKNYGSVAGNVIGGVGDIIRGVGGGIMKGKLRNEQMDLMKQGQAAQMALLDKKDASRIQSGQAQMEAIRKLQEALMRREQQPQFGTQSSGAGFGLPGLQFDPYGM